MGKTITFGKLKISVLKHMGKNITFGIYKNILQLNNMGENGFTEAGPSSKRFSAALRCNPITECRCGAQKDHTRGGLRFGSTQTLADTPIRSFWQIK